MARLSKIERALRRGVAVGPLRVRRLSGGTRVALEWRSGARRFKPIQFEVVDNGVDRATGLDRRRAGPRVSPPQLVVKPYLDGEALEALERRGQSGVDLCGNALIQVPPTVYVRVSGNPDRSRDVFPLKSVYRGTASIVPRALLLRRGFEGQTQLMQFVTERAGEVTAPTVSKALKQLERDVMVARKGRSITARQADALLERLADAYRAPKPTAAPTEFRCSGDVWQVIRELDRRAARDGERIVVSGADSVTRYASAARTPPITVYMSRFAAPPPELAKPSSVFADLRLVEIAEQLPYFDLRRVDDIPWASPIQCYVELMASDKRDQDVAEQVRAGLLNEPGEGRSDER